MKLSPETHRLRADQLPTHSHSSIPQNILNDALNAPAQCPVSYNGKHVWRLTGYDASGLLCEAGASWDISGGMHERCTCGASAFGATKP